MNKASMRASRGFSLLEVLVTLLIVALGLLGLTKMQAAALSNTQIARVRSLIALQAGSLAAAMHGNRAYWANGLAPASVSATGTTITDATGVLNATADCLTAVCTPAQLAAYDLQSWVANMNAGFPSYTAGITCSTVVGSPISCIVKVTWEEKYVAINRSTTAALGATQTGTQEFSLFVEP